MSQPLEAKVPESSFITWNPADHTPTEVYKLLIGSVVPRPIAWVSTQSTEGQSNLAPFSFFNAVCANPPTVMISLARRGSDNQKKDTLRNIEATGDFVVNLVSTSLAEAMNATAAEYPPEVSEFDQAGLTATPSLCVAAPRVLEAPIAMECQLSQIITLGSGKEPGNAFMVLGKVVQFHIRSDVYDERGYIRLEAFQPVGRLAGAAYCRVNDVFELPRP